MFLCQKLLLLKTLLLIISVFSISKVIFFSTTKYKGIQFHNDYYQNNLDKKKALKNGRKFFKKCIDDALVKHHNFKKNDVPLASIIIPVYNAEYKIKKAIRSIQNQNISNLEIILVNDHSKDKTDKIIKNLQKEDERIILIQNKENKGIFYTRCIGTLKASGKFIFPLDNDDLFFDEGIIDSIVEEAMKNKFDIVEFNYAEYFNPKNPPHKLISSEFGNHSHNLILYQPELGLFSRKKNNTYGVFDCYIWAKCIKTEIYKKSINKIGIELYSKFILRGEDFIITFVLFKMAKSFKYFSKYGIFRFKNMETAQYQSSRELYLLSRIIYLDVIRKYTKNYPDRMYVIDFSNKFLKIMREDINILSNENKIYFKEVFQRLLDNKYISTKVKNKFISFFKNVAYLSK